MYPPPISCCWRGLGSAGAIPTHELPSLSLYIAASSISSGLRTSLLHWMWFILALLSSGSMKGSTASSSVSSSGSSSGYIWHSLRLSGDCWKSFNLSITISRHTSLLPEIPNHVVCMTSRAGGENFTIFQGPDHLAESAPEVPSLRYGDQAHTSLCKCGGSPIRLLALYVTAVCL